MYGLHEIMRMNDEAVPVTYTLPDEPKSGLIPALIVMGGALVLLLLAHVVGYYIGLWC